MARIDLDALVKTYGPYSRSLRVFRGLAGTGALVIVLAPLALIVVLPFLSDPVSALPAIGVVMCLGLMAVATYESLAESSLFAIRTTIAIVGALAAGRLAVILSALFDTGARWQVTLPVALGMALNLTVLWMIVRGLLPLALDRRASERQLFGMTTRERSGAQRWVRALR